MYKIINKQLLAPDIKRIDLLAENIANKIQPGQYVIVTPDARSRRLPLTVADHDPKRGIISLIFQETDNSTRKLGAIAINETLNSLLGPLGNPAKIEKVGVVVCLSTGMGAAQILPICRAYKKAGNKVIGIIGAKTRRSLVLEAQMRLACNKFFVATNDGSYMRRGLASDVLKDVLAQEKVNLIYAIGSVEMMQAASKMAKDNGIKALVSLHPVIVDGTGQCGSCRVTINGKTILACIEGPEFDGHQVDYQELAIRMNAVKETEEWGNSPLTHSLNNGAVGTLKKFLSDIAKNRP